MGCNDLLHNFSDEDGLPLHVSMSVWQVFGATVDGINNMGVYQNVEL